MTYKIKKVKEQSNYAIYLHSEKFSPFRVGIFESKPTKKEIESMRAFISNVIKWTLLHCQTIDLRESK